LKQALTEGHAHFINSAGKEVHGATEVTSTACLGNVREPSAVAGEFCVYAASSPEGVTMGSEGIMAPGDPEEEAAGRAGAVMVVQAAASAECQGTWAVTAG
jgi:hypothetical protein